MGKHLLTRLLLLLAITFGSLAAFTQVGNVTGTVTDASDGTTLPGASVVVKGTSQGTVTDVDGNYTISVTPSAKLVFSFVGYETQELLVQPNTTVNVALKMESTVLSELVVIGYGVQKKGDATGSVTAIDAKEFNIGSITTPSDLINGKIAGVQIVNEGGAPGGTATVRIRGGSSLSASNDPLYVIDGVPVDNDGISGERNPLNSINPSDIETFTVLKDASATAIYGSRASNGVIIITTKKGKAAKGGKPFVLNYTANFSMNTVAKKVDVLDANEFTDMINERYPGKWVNDTTYNKSPQQELLGTSSTEWQEEIYDNAFGMDHYLSLAGKISVLPYRVSLGYSDQDGILKTDNMKRTTIAASLSPILFDDHLKVDVNFKTSFTKNFFANRGAISGALQFDPTKPVYNDSTYLINYTDTAGNVQSLNTDYGGYWAWLQDDGWPVGQATSNPVAQLNLRDDESDVNRIIGNVQIDYKMHFFPDLRANLNIGTDRSNSDGSVIVPEYASWEFDPTNGGGVYNTYEQEKKNDLLEFYLNYAKNVESISSTFDVMAGYSWQHFWRKNYSINGNFDRTFNIDTIDDRTESYLVSFFGRFNYTFKDKYLLTFTLRDDGTSRFSEDNRWGLFPSVALGWKIKDEPWLANSKTLSQLKLRAGWGVTGQQNINQGDYPYLPIYTISQPDAAYLMGNIYYLTLRPEGYDPNIKWEETTTWNIGLDYGFAKDRFYGSLDFYLKQTTDLINEIPVPAGSNNTNYILTNVGDLENRGVEISLYARAITNNNWNWLIGFNATYNENEITKLTVSDDPNYLGVATGGISGGVGNNVQIHSVGYPASSFLVYEQVYDANGKPIENMFVDRNGDGQITTDDKYYYKSPAPKFYFGISSSLQYKNWDFSFAGRANFGNYVYNNVSSENGVYERLYRPEGPYLSNITSDVTDVGFTSPRYWSDYYVQDGSFFRMDNIGLGYNFKNLIKQKERLNIRISFTVNNAFIITQYKGIDPEIYGGIDNNVYPRPRTFVLGLNVEF